MAFGALALARLGAVGAAWRAVTVAVLGALTWSSHGRKKEKVNREGGSALALAPVLLVGLVRAALPPAVADRGALRCIAERVAGAMPGALGVDHREVIRDGTGYPEQ